MPSVPIDSTSPSRRRRPRRDSTSSSSSSSSVTEFKRVKIHATVNMPSAKARGKLPDTTTLVHRPSAFQPHKGARKLVIKNLRPAGHRQSQLAEYYARTERELEVALDAIFAGRAAEVTLERLYRGVEDLCRNGGAETVYEMLSKRCEQHLKKVVMVRIQRDGGLTSMGLVKAAVEQWAQWNSKTLVIRSTFSFLDRTFLVRQNLRTINDMAISHFRRACFQSIISSHPPTSVGQGIISGILELIDHDRRSDGMMDDDLLKEAIRMIFIQGVYTKHFEPAFLSGSLLFFQEFGETWDQAPLKRYISALEQLLQKEEQRCLEYSLDSTTQRQLTELAHRVLVEGYSEKLLDGGNVATLLADREVGSVKALYQLLRLSGIQKNLKEPWNAYIRQAGAAIIRDKERGGEMVLRLLDLRRSLDIMIRDAFDKDEDFLWGMRESFANFMNDRWVAGCWSSGTSKIGEMIAKYIDNLLRGGLKTLPKGLLSDVKDRATAEKEGHSSTADEDAELDRQLDQALELFRFIEGKDTFEAFYKKDLARRLLMGRSASQDAERNMLTKLRSECGSNFTHNLEQMFKDQELAREEVEAYKQWCQGAEERRGPLDLQVMILSASAWPSYPDVRINLPEEVAKLVEQFDAYYRSKHTGRTLTWKHVLAHCSIKASFPKGSKELIVSACQAAVLMLFNSVPDDGFLAYEHIATGTGLQGKDLERTLQSLACGKARVLNKYPKGKNILATDTFAYNRAFQDPKYRVKINQIQFKESKEESVQTHERVAQDRRFETQAAIVRIMKSRKRMGHSDLVAEVINLTKKRGSVEPAAIKKEIESLLEKDYIEREDGMYVYQA